MKKRTNLLLMLFFALITQIGFAQQITVTGTVSDDAGPLPGVSIVIEGTATGTDTDFDGLYTIQAEKGQTLVFSFVGLQTVKKLVGDATTIDVVMTNDNVLEEVVVLGYSDKSRETLSSAVTSVTTKELEEVAQTNNVANALQGKASGVTVTAQNGKPGQTAFVRVRGTGSINGGQEPLYIVDGVAISESDLNLINSSDIESMSVLKDAATAAIYGARGSNGVVVITTKGGKKDRDAKFTLNSQIGYSERIDDGWDLMNAEQKLDYEKELGIGVGASASDEERAALIKNDHDWRETLLKKGFTRSNALSVTGGSEKTTYFVSLKNEEDTGIIDGLDGYKRTTGRVNFTFDARDWLTIGAKTGASYTISQEPRDRNNAQNPFRAMYTYNPYETKYELDADGNVKLDDNGNPVYNYTHAGFSISEAIVNNPETDKFLRIFNTMNADVRFNENVSYSTKVGLNYRRYKGEYFVKPGSILDGYVGDANAPGSKRDSGSDRFTFNYQNILKYKNTFNEKHNFGALVLSEYITTVHEGYSLRSKGFPTDKFDEQVNASDPTGASTTKFEETTFSIAASVDYDYDQKYIATASFRRDGSSKFGANNRYGNFWSASAAWNIANEDFLKDVEFLSALKLRASYGTLGNDRIGNYGFLGLYSFGAYNGSSASFPSRTENPDLKWESKAITDIGLEYGFLGGRVRGVFDYYKSVTSDLLSNKILAFETGAPGLSVVQNNGEIQTEGFEIELSGDIIRNSDLKWTVGGNIAFSKTKVNSLVGGDDQIIGGGNIILREGEEVNTHYLVRYAGVNSETGLAQYYDKEGNITDQYSADDAVALSGKSVNPDFDGSFFTRAEYKGFELSANFYFKFGNYIYNNVKADLESDGSNAFDNQSVSAFNYWKNPGDTGVLPAPQQLSGIRSDVASDRFLQDGSYIRLRSLKLGYTVPRELVEKIKLSDVKLYVQGQNLWTWTKEYEGDPEIGVGSGEATGEVAGSRSLYSYPTTKTYLVGLDISF
ncbi:SusC/RagA family TonB-linked outer membrane protein [Aureivirga sp. CE67]|uniref:SusC/RagA family TonB-linked outer membrane protein n=1 Tax=Aureivirga sp. CE67 TaxID=1788983 RepID=UPI0018CBE8CE|nr:SusC/RagA family TonB-linked outer membrane protein [Aureivirga sp. CE67]